MTKKHRPKKRGPKEQRLIIRDDPAEALSRLLKPGRVPVKPSTKR